MDKQTGKVAQRKRPVMTYGDTQRLRTGCGSIYVTINEDEAGLCEVFCQMGKAGGCALAQLEAIGRLVSMSLRGGFDVQEIIQHLKGIRCPSPGNQGTNDEVLSCADAVAIALIKHLEPKESPGCAQPP